MGSAANWRRVVPAFKDKFQILTFDQRGHGASFKPSSGYTPDDYALDLRLILDELGWSKIILVGHSMGGRNALQFADKYSERLSGLVIEDIGPEGNKAATQRTIDMVKMIPAPFINKNVAKDYFSTEFVEKLRGRPGAKTIGQYLYTNIEVLADGRADWRFAKDAILSSLSSAYVSSRWEVVQALKIPTLFIRGETSEEFPRAEFEQVLASNSKIQGVEIKGAGHWVHSDRSTEFIEALATFFRDRLGF